MKRKPLLITAGILLLFIITNPSVSSFKTYRGRSGYNGLSRPINLLVASVYDDGGRRYIGVMENFFKITSEPTQTSHLSEIPVSKPERKLSVSEFARLIKTKYPAYKDVDDKILVERIIAKYPVYRDTVNLQSK